MNPNISVIVLFLTSSNLVKVKTVSEFQSLYQYSNIHFRYFHIEDLTNDTPIEKWIKGGHLNRSKYPVTHTSDVLRFALLYKYSGTYLDLDVIVTRSMDEIKSSNFICHEESYELNGAILRISKENSHKIGRLLLQ